MPFVASEACWRKTASPLSLQTSMGMWSRWQANMQFIMGMYWCAEPVELLTETMRMRDWRPVVEEAEGVCLEDGFVVVLLSKVEEELPWVSE